MLRRSSAAAMLLVSTSVLFAVVGVGYAADSPKGLRELRATARIRAAVYLRGLRELDPVARRATSGDFERQAAIQATWARIAGIPAELEQMRRQAEALAGTAGESADSLRSIADGVTQIARAIQRMDDRYRPLLGEPPPSTARRAVVTPAARSAPASPGGPLGSFLSGRVSAAAGSARFNPINLSGTDQHSGTPDFMLRGGLRPNETTSLTATLSHKRLVEQLAVAHTDASLAFEQSPGRRLRYRAEAGYRGYGEDDADLRDYGEARLQAGGEFALTNAARLEAQYRMETRDHAKTAAADFASHRVDGGLRVESSRLRLQVFMSLQKRDAHVQGGDFTRQEPRLVIESAAPGRAPSGIAASLETYDFPGDSVLTSRQVRADAYLGRGADGRLGVGYVGYERPEAGEAAGVQGYEDFSIYSQRRTTSRTASGSGDLALVYRRDRSGPSPDYASLTLHQRRRVRDSWLPRRELHVAARVFQSETGRATGEHFGDLKILLGWDVGAPAGLHIGMDALTGGRVFVNPDAKDNADPEDDGALENLRNTAKIGGALRLSRAVPRGPQVSGSIKFERTFAYNVQPTRTQNDLAVAVDARYTLSSAWLFEASASLFRSRTAGAQASTDFDRSNIRIGTTYIFNTGGGSRR